MDLKMTIPELHDYLTEIFPQMRGRFEVLEMQPGRLRVRMQAKDADLRPGGTVSGPALFALADCSFYLMLLAVIGREPLTVTTGCSIDFMRKPAPGALIAETRLLKLGRSLAVGDVLICAESAGPPVARASLTYALPPRPKAGVP